MPVERVDPPADAPEQEMLVAWLDYQRATLELKCDGLAAAALATRSVPPSTLSLLGLVRHMADVERGWFRRTMAGEEAPPLYYSDTDRDGDFDNVDGADSDQAFETWRVECEFARQLVAGAASLDIVAVRSRPDITPTLRWVLVHMIEEYARHNGHADLLRQCIDGAVGD